MSSKGIEINCVIVGPDHYNTLNIVRALGQANVATFLLLIGDRHTFVDKSRFCKHYSKIDDYDSITEFLRTKFENYSYKIPLIATNDRSAAAIDNNYNILSKYFILPNADNKSKGILLNMDKWRQQEVAIASGFSVPISQICKLDGDNVLDVDFAQFPCIIKPVKSISGSKHDMSVCYSRSELNKNLESLKKKSINECLIQQFLPNEHIKLVGGVRTNQGETILTATIHKEKIGRKTHTLGLTATGRLIDDKSLFDKCTRYLELINYHGLFSFEFLEVTRDNITKDYFVELNLRTDAAFYYYNKAGINLPYFWVASCFGEEISSDIEVKPVQGMNEFLYFEEYFRLKSLVKCVKDICLTDCFGVFSLKDIKPFIYKLINR